MRSRIALAVALVAVLVGSSLIAAPGAARASVAAAPLAPHPAATDSVTPFTLYGGCSYCVGYGTGNVYWQAYDPVDTSAKVAINDQNATRDGLSNPVYSTTVSFATSTFNDSETWGISFLIPLTLQWGGWWNITISGASAGFSSTNFLVHTYTVSLSPTQPAYLPQHPGTIVYSVNSTVNNAPFHGTLSAVTLTAIYQTSTGTLVALPGTPKTLPTSPAWGTFNFTVPSNVNTYSAIQFVLYANATVGNTTPTESGITFAYTGYLSGPQVALADCATGYGCQTSNFQSGAIAYVLVRAVIYSPGGTAAASNISVTFEFATGVTPVTPTGNFPTNLKTNTTGEVEILFVASASVFTDLASNSVKVSLADPLDTATTSGPTTVNFAIFSPTAGLAGLRVTLSSSEYYGGDTATANWVVGGLNGSSVSGWTVQSWWVWEYQSSSLYTTALIGSGTINTTSTSGAFSFPIPLNYGDEIIVQVNAYNATSSIAGSTSAYVFAPTIFLNPSESFYFPGDTVTVAVATQGSALGNASMWESVTDSNGDTLSSGPLTGNSISFTVSKVLPPNSVSISVSAQSPTLGVIAAATTSVSEGSGLVTVAGVQTASNYIDGSYQPGETISISYTITAVGRAVLPKVFDIVVYPGPAFYGSFAGTQEYEVSAASGTVQYTIPSNMPAGDQVFAFEVDASYCGTGCFSGTWFAVSVQPNPSALSYEVGAGSGLTVGWLILFVIIVLLAIVGYVMLRRRGRPMMMKPHNGGSPPSSGGAPPAGASGSPEWKEGSGSPSSTSSGSGSSSPPDLPKSS